MGNGIDRYVARLMAVPFAATLAIFAMLLLLVRMAELLTVVMEGGGTPLTMLRLLGYLAPQYLAMAIPVGLVAGVVLAFRRLALSGEWDALSSAGISPARLLRVPMMYAALSAAIVFLIASAVQPLSVYASQKLLHDLSHGADGLSVPAGEFVRLGPDTVVRARGARARGRDLRGVLVSRRDADGQLTVIAADRALLSTSEVRLFRGTTLTVGGGAKAVAFGTMRFPTPVPDAPAFRPRGTHERELTWMELIGAARGNVADVSAGSAHAGLARRFAQALVLLALPLFALGFARPPLRSAESSGLFIAIAGFIVFNEISLFAERLGFNAQVPSIAAQAAVFVTFTLLSVLVFVVTAPRPAEVGASPWTIVLRALMRPRASSNPALAVVKD